MPLTADLQKLSTSPIVELFMLANFNPANSSDVFRFTPWRTVLWLGKNWTHLDAKTSGFESNGRTFPKPQISIANIQNSIGSLVQLYDDLLGATLWRYRTLESYLQIGSAELLQVEQWTIQQKTTHNNLTIGWELSILDLENRYCPGRAYRSNYCASQYRSSECGYTGPPVADINDNPVSTMALDVCGRKLGSCKLRFGANAELPIDYFPGVV
jgi:lambda family phage minor tail protein L